MPGGLVLEEEGRAGRSYYRQQSLAEAREEARAEIEAQRRDQHVRQAEQNERRRTPDAWDPEYVVQAQFDFEDAFLHGRPTAWEVADLDTMYADWARGAVTPAARIFHASAPFLLGGALAALWSVLRHPQSGPVTQARHDQALELAQPFQRPPAGGFDFTPRIEEQARFSMAMAHSQMQPLTFRATDAWGVQNLPVINWARTRGLELVTDLTEQQLLATQGIILDALGGNLARETVAPLIELTIDLHPTQAKWVQDRLARDLASGMSRQEAYVQSRAFTEQLLRQRAMVIARTEIMAAENMGQLEAWRQASRDGLLPKEARKVWVMGPGACPTCAQVNGRAVKLEDPFPVVDVLVPPAHPNCRCTVGLAADRGRVADLAGINLRTHQPLAKHLMGQHDQKTHGHRGNAGGERERIDKATARIQAALPNADLSGMVSQMSSVQKATLEQMQDGRSLSYKQWVEAGYPPMEWNKDLHGVKLAPTASEMEAIADAAEHLRKVAPLAADDCLILDFESLVDDTGLNKNLAQADWAVQGTHQGWRITFDLERSRFAFAQQHGTTHSIAEDTYAARVRTSSLFRQASTPSEAQRIVALHEFAHGVAMSGERARNPTQRPSDLTETLLVLPTPAGLAAAPSHASPPNRTTGESRAILEAHGRIPANEAVSDYALANAGEFFAENVASLWSGVGRPHGDTQHWLNEYLLWRSRMVNKAVLNMSETGAIEDDFGEEPWLGWDTEISKHQLGRHDQKSHGRRGQAAGAYVGMVGDEPERRIAAVIAEGGRVDLTGLSVATIDEVVWALEDFAKKYPDAARNIAAVDTRDRQADEGTNAVTYAAVCEVGRPDGTTYERPYLFVGINPTNIQNRQALALDHAMGQTVVRNPYDVVVHEMGHVLDLHKQMEATDYSPEGLNFGDMAAHEHIGNSVPGNPRDIDYARDLNLSGYAQTNIMEAVAEGFTADFLGPPPPPRAGRQSMWTEGTYDLRQQPDWFQNLIARMKAS